MKRSLVVEGCDGSGKDTLIKELIQIYPSHTLHERASTSLGGPVANLAQWVEHDADRMHLTGPWIYNRHPMVSEFIYAFLRESNAGFQSPEWQSRDWVSKYRRMVADHTLLIICQPPADVVLKTIRSQGKDAHMPGVYDNARELWNRYSMLVWPGKTIRYDYTKNKLASLVEVINHYMEY